MRYRDLNPRSRRLSTPCLIALRNPRMSGNAQNWEQGWGSHHVWDGSGGWRRYSCTPAVTHAKLTFRTALRSFRGLYPKTRNGQPAIIAPTRYPASYEYARSKPAPSRAPTPYFPRDQRQGLHEPYASQSGPGCRADGPAAGSRKAAFFKYL
jgi:hypothetical protein